MGLKVYDLRVAAVFVAAFLGFLALFVAYSYTGSVPAQRTHADFLTELPDARSARFGDTVAVDGAIAPDTPLLHKDYVLFDRRQTQGTAPRGSTIVTIEVAKQPFTIDTPYGPVRVINDDYSLDNRFTDWTRVEDLDEPATWTEGGITVRGLKRASPVLAVGVLESDGDQRSLRAETIVAGPKDDYVAELRQHAVIGSDTIIPATGIGVVLLLYAFWDGRRLLREPR